MSDIRGFQGERTAHWAQGPLDSGSEPDPPFLTVAPPLLSMAPPFLTVAPPLLSVAPPLPPRLLPLCSAQAAQSSETQRSLDGLEQCDVNLTR